LGVEHTTQPNPSPHNTPTHQNPTHQHPKTKTHKRAQGGGGSTGKKKKNQCVHLTQRGEPLRVTQVGVPPPTPNNTQPRGENAGGGGVCAPWVGDKKKKKMVVGWEKKPHTPTKQGKTQSKGGKKNHTHELNQVKKKQGGGKNKKRVNEKQIAWTKKRKTEP